MAIFWPIVHCAHYKLRLNQHGMAHSIYSEKIKHFNVIQVDSWVHIDNAKTYLM